MCPGKFAEFWEEYNANTDTIKAVDFLDRMRNTFARIVKLTFKTISCEELKTFLNITASSDLQKFAASSPEIENIEDDDVIMASCPENQPRTKIATDSLRFDEALRLIDSLRAAKSV